MADMIDRHWRGRVEDEPLLRGEGRFAADAALPKQAVGCFVRSPHAFARIRGIDITAARAHSGVIAVVTAADVAAAKAGNVSRPVPLASRDGTPQKVPFRPALAGERVHHVGEAVALVVAETRAAAQDAADLVHVDYEAMPPAVELRAAASPGAPQLYAEAPGNIAVDWAMGGEAADLKAIDEAFRTAAHRASVSLVNQRIVVASMEPRGATAAHDAASDHYSLRCCSQGVGMLRDQLAGILGLERDRLQVMTEDVGGGFGMKSSAYPEYVALLVAAKLTARPVHWMSTRSEAFLMDNQARDTLTDAEIALDAEGRFLALRV
ncbi:MAG TPA: molybdopterin cofactor-binding domain-containing protein, partial [Stellaceae bacterium]|nr:molybdopterin cofactor-binding domain-containing protein [Stellaceae bacterium]